MAVLDQKVVGIFKIRHFSKFPFRALKTAKKALSIDYLVGEFHQSTNSPGPDFQYGLIQGRPFWSPPAGPPNPPKMFH